MLAPIFSALVFTIGVSYLAANPHPDLTIRWLQSLTVAFLCSSCRHDGCRRSDVGQPVRSGFWRVDDCSDCRLCRGRRRGDWWNICRRKPEGFERQDGRRAPQPECRVQQIPSRWQRWQRWQRQQRTKFCRGYRQVGKRRQRQPEFKTAQKQQDTNA